MRRGKNQAHFTGIEHTEGDKPRAGAAWKWEKAERKEDWYNLILDG